MEIREGPSKRILSVNLRHDSITHVPHMDNPKAVELIKNTYGGKFEMEASSHMMRVR